MRPDGTLIYQPRYFNPNFQQRNSVPQIYPGQIINGERVIGPSVTAPPLGRPEAVNPPPPVSNSDQNQNPSQSNQQPPQSQRPDKIPRTNFPIPPGPALQSEAESAPVAANAKSTDAVPNETPKSSESSFANKEKSDPPQQEIPADQPLTPELPQQAPPAQPELAEMELAEPTSLSALSLDEVSSEEAPSDELPLEPPTLAPSENVSDDEMALAPAAIDEDIMAEIKQIRDQLGGGISETLKDVDQMPSFGAIEITAPQDEAATTERQASPEELFNEELRSVMAEQETKGSPISEPSQPSLPASASSQTQSNYAYRTEELRTCARELEQLAGRLETIEAYEHADQLRRQAAEIWTTARKR